MANSFKIDINADLGEGLNNEELLMPLISSCNIACGGHAGDEETMQRVLKLAKHHNVKVGAHPSFPDKANFGREIMSLDPGQLFDSVLSQTIDLYNIAQREGVNINHIKPHGALYNLASVDPSIAKLIINVILSFPENIKLYAPYNSVLANLAKKENIEVVYEAFADRNYNDDLTLVSRKKDNAVLHKKEAVLTHVLEMIKHQKVTSVNGLKLDIKASTFCVHGDTKNAVEILEFLNKELPVNGVEVE